MGDRGNICVNQEDGNQIVIYSHWGGLDLPVVLKSALIRGESRWSDTSYLTRIVFNEVTRGIEFETTGVGLSTHITDNEYPVLTVDPVKQTVTVDARSKSFEEYVAMTDEQVIAFRGRS